MSKLLPWIKEKMSPFINIETLDMNDIPEQSGVYIMLSDHTEYVYPWSDKHGNSQVYYIGRSTNLRTRLKTHKRYYLQRIVDRDPDHYWPFYEYAVHHGCNVVWIISTNPKEFEHELLDTLQITTELDL